MTVGASPIRIDAHAKTTGEAQYPGDRAPDGALVGLVTTDNLTEFMRMQAAATNT